MSLPCGIRNYTYAEDMAILRTRTHWVLFVLFLAFLFTLPLYMANRWLGVANLIGITLIAATGLNILIGYCGQLSIGHAGFIAVGAYTAAILTNRFELPFLVGLICAGLAAGVVGLIFGIPSVRVKGFYLAITTIAAQFIIIWVINHWSITGGFAAEVMGINLFYYKMLAFFIGCFLAGIAGSLLAHWIGFMNAEHFTLTESILYVGMIIIGGLGTTLGPILGVVFVRLLQQGVLFLTPAIEAAFPVLPSGFASGIAPMLFGLVIILFLILEPRGFAHRWMLFKSAYRLWPFSY
ncbi:hypothetical protein ES703_76998 [subsurface metagenome]